MALSFINDETSLFNFVVKDGNGVKGLVDLGVTEVPVQYVQPPDQRINTAAGPVESMTIDLSELDGPDHDQVVKAIGHAAETLGFFQVVNHGVPLELLESLKVAAHQFFNQPTEKKAVYLKGVSPTPNIYYGSSFFPENEKVLEWKDFICITYTNDADALRFWPNECKELLLEYIKSSRDMISKIFHALILNLEVKLEDSRLDEFLGLNLVVMNLYPPCPNPELTVGVGSHSDADTLTVLLQDGIGGLSIRKKESEEWIEIPPIDGALVVNVGDVLQILSNGRYTSADHRVRNTSTESRVSIPIFASPPPTMKIGPFPECVAQQGMCRYREVSYGEYKTHYMEQSLKGKKSLDFISI